jgi:CrcB protein
MWNWIAVAAGGALGAAARYGISGLSQRYPGALVPLGTLVVNGLGCLAIGLLAPLLLQGPVVARPELRAFLLIGLLGGLTTFSTFSYETVALLEGGAWPRALVNIALHNVLGLALCFGGFRLGSALVRAF